VAVVETVEVEVEKEVVVTATAAPVEEIPYGLTPGKPYDGTTLRMLICCPTAAQFAKGAIMAQEGEEFHQLTGISVEWDMVAWGSFFEKLLVETTSSMGDFDVVSWVDSWGHAIKPYLMPLNQYIERDGYDMSDFPQAYVDAASDGEGLGYIYGIPYRGHPLIMYYRQDVFDELGLEVPKDWQEVVEAGKVIKAETDMTPIAMYYAGMEGGQNLFLWLAMLWGNGGDIFDADYRPIFNNEAGVEATQFYVDILLKEGLASDAAVTNGEGEASNEFEQGSAAMFINWWWRWSRMANPELAVPEVMEHAAFAPAPGWEGEEPITYGYIWPVGMSQFSQNQEAAWEYLKYMTHADIEKRIAVDKSDPALATNVVVRNSNLQDPDVNEAWGGLQAVAYEVLKTAKTQPLVTPWAEVQFAIAVGLNEMASGADVKETLDRVAAEVEGFMERAGYYD
jgi:multiple sugar transport system substrate-binding protein